MEAFFASPWFWFGLAGLLLLGLMVDSYRNRRPNAMPKRKAQPVEERRATFDPAKARTVKKPRR